ncbi:MAG TPA: hypothetical protein VK054_06530 [Beutenbergiaceae bacterium]|nr:hypothetical protein [Beutenbergiaceae bacterium]
MNNHHHCPGLGECESHPKMAVSKFRSRHPCPTPWEVWEPHNAGVEFFPTHAEAINYAQKEATR